LPRGPRASGPPILIGARQPRMLRLTAQYADAWNTCWLGQPTLLPERRAALEAACAEVGRDPATIELSVQVPVNYDDLEETVQAVQRYVDAGATHLILNLRYPYPDGIVTRLAEEVVPRVRA
jgi:alkanesulfonate monooxygenase SsuD/methylene tetrahydromethanopterin reductase-like flavin-dependent oxidoreductase (luciferase family)